MKLGVGQEASSSKWQQQVSKNVTPKPEDVKQRCMAAVEIRDGVQSWMISPEVLQERYLQRRLSWLQDTLPDRWKKPFSNDKCRENILWKQMLIKTCRRKVSIADWWREECSQQWRHDESKDKQRKHTYLHKRWRVKISNAKGCSKMCWRWRHGHRKYKKMKIKEAENVNKFQRSRSICWKSETLTGFYDLFMISRLQLPIKALEWKPTLIMNLSRRLHGIDARHKEDICSQVRNDFKCKDFWRILGRK